MKISGPTYISGPMTGIPDLNYPTFDQVAKELRSVNIGVLNPADNERGPVESHKSWEHYFRMDIHQLLTCGSIVVLPGWRNSKGACLEVTVGNAIGLPVFEYPSYRKVEIPPFKPFGEIEQVEETEITNEDLVKSLGELKVFFEAIKSVFKSEF